MDQKSLREWEARCVQECPPGCTAGCPVHVDARGMIAAIQKGDYSAGFALFHRMVPFPGIISRICDQPCSQTCKRQEIDESISINALEKVCIDNNEKLPVPVIPLPRKDKKAAIVGAGLSGLTVAVELSRKGYEAVIFEATDHLGGRVRDIPESQLPRLLVEKDFAILEKLQVKVHYSTAIGGPGTSLARLCEDFDAVYLGAGYGGAAIVAEGFERGGGGNIAIDPLTLATSNKKVFAGGSLRWGPKDYSPIRSISEGKIAAVSIDRLFQNASLGANRSQEGQFASCLYTNVKGIKPQTMTLAADPVSGYTREEASREAGRCLLCECLECVKACEYLAHYGSYPKRYVREIYNNLSIVMGIHHANKMINSCSLCGLCGQICPDDLNMAEVCLEARQMLVDKGKMPPSAHDFALQDMQFSHSEKFVLQRHQPGFKASTAVFFPGCQLAASLPRQVQKTYEYLCSKIDGGVGLMLDCCGAPANWAGQTELFGRTLERMEQSWRDIGSPRVITACPSCFSIFQRTLPNIPVETLWTALDRIGLPEPSGSKAAFQSLAVHDSCATRNDTQVHSSVRSILGKLGCQTEELPRSREFTICCGYGGLMIFANREVANKEIARRIKESETDYLTYCSMCRDNFISAGKRTVHLLELIFGLDEADLAKQKAPDYSERHENRAKLKTRLLREVWGEPVDEQKAAVKAIIPENVRQVMEERMILVDDVVTVIDHAEKSGNRLQCVSNGHYIAYFQPVSVTYWVEYSPQGDGFLVHNAYCHRLQIIG